MRLPSLRRTTFFAGTTAQTYRLFQPLLLPLVAAPFLPTIAASLPVGVTDYLTAGVLVNAYLAVAAYKTFSYAARVAVEIADHMGQSVF